MARSSVPKGKARYPVYRRRATDRTLFRRYKPPTVQTPLVTTSYTISTTPDPYSQSGPQGPFVDSSTGYLYTFLRDGAALEAWRSTDGGQNWTEQDAANHPDGPASGNMGGFSCFQVGSVIHIAVMHGGDNALYYNKFSTSTNTWDGTYKDFLVHDFTDTSSEWSCQMLVLANGDLFIASSSENGFGGRTGRESIVYHYSQNGGSSWTKNNDWYGNSNGDTPSPQFVFGESEKIHGFVRDEWNTDGTNTIFHRSLVGVTGTPSAAEAFAVPSSGVAESNWFHPGRAFYIDDSGTERIVAVYNGEPGAMDNAAPFDLWAYEVVDDGTPSTPVQVTARGVKANEAAVNKGCVTGAVDPSTGTLYVLYVEEQSEDIYLSTRQNGGAWVKDRLFFSGDINILYANIYVRSGFYRLGVVYDDTYSGGYGTTKFLEYQLGAAANVVTADPSTGRARGTATAAGSVIEVAQTAGRARGHATAAASVTATGAAHGRSVGRATATASVVTASSAVGQGSSRSATLGSVVVIGAAQGWSTGRGTAPEPTTIATVTGTAQGYSRATGTATGSTIVIGAAQGRSASRATSAAYAVATGTATGRGRGRGTSTALCIVTAGGGTGDITAPTVRTDVSTAQGGTFTPHANWSDGDLMVVFAMGQDNAGSLPSGWSEILSGTSALDDGIEYTGYLHYRIASKVKSGTGTANFDVSNGGVAGIALANFAVPPDATTTATGTQVGTSLNTSQVNDLLLVFANAIDSVSYNPPPSGMTEKVDYQLQSAFGRAAVEISHEVRASAGATGTRTATYTGTGSWFIPGQNISLVAIKGAAAVVGGGHGRSHGFGTAAATIIRSASAVGRGKGRATADSTVIPAAQTVTADPTSGWASGRGSATGSAIVVGAAQGYSHGRDTATATVTTAAAAAGRARGRGTGTGLCIVYGGKRTPSIAASSSPQVSTGTFAVGLPAGVKEGDLILLLIEMANQSTSDTTDPGVDGTYTKLFGQWNQTGSVAVSGAYLYAKVAGAAESDPTITETVTWNHLHVQSFIVRDHGLTSVAQVTVGAGNTGTGITATALGITVAIDDLVLIAAFTSEDLDSTTYWSGWTNANLSNITEWADAVTSSFAGGGFGLAVGRALTSSIGDSTVTKASAAWQAVQLGVRAGYGALGRASTRASTTGTTIRPASAVGWGQSRATADSTVIPAAQIVTADPVAGRSAGRGTASALVITSSTAQGNATGRGTATATATTTSSAVGRGVGRAVSVATVVTSSTAVGWAHARQMPMSLGIAISAAHGRAAGRATATGSVIVVSAAVGWSHARQMPMALGIPLASAHGRAHAHGTATASAITTTAAAQGWAHGYAPAMWLEVGVVTAQGLSRTRGRGSISASVTTAAAATARARGRATGVPLIIRSGAGRGWALARATAVATPLVLSASSLPGARGRAAAVAQRIAQGAAIGRGRAWGSANASVITTSTAIARTRGRATSSYAQVGLQTSAGAGWARARSAAVAQPITTSGVAAGQAHGTATAASVVTTTSASAGRARSHATGVGVRLLTSAGAGHGHGRSTAVPAVFATGAAVGHGRSRATAVCALQVLSASRASGRSAARVSSAATTTFGSAWARGRGRATASPLVRGLTEATLHLNAEAENFPLAFGGVADGGIHLNAQTELDALLASASSRSRGRQKATMQP